MTLEDIKTLASDVQNSLGTTAVEHPKFDTNVTKLCGLVVTLAQENATLAQNLEAASGQALNLITQASIAEAQLLEVQFLLRKKLSEQLGRADLISMEEAVKLKGPRWMLEALA